MVLISTAISTQAATLDEISMWNKQHTHTKNTDSNNKTHNIFECLHFSKNQKETIIGAVNIKCIADSRSTETNTSKPFHFVLKYLQNVIITEFNKKKTYSIFDTEFLSTYKHILSAKFVFTFQLICLWWSVFFAPQFFSFTVVYIRISLIWLLMLIHLWSSVNFLLLLLLFWLSRHLSK